MQKVQKHVIKLQLVLLLASFVCIAQTKQDYELFNLVVQETKSDKSDFYILNELSSKGYNESFKHYYEYRYLNKNISVLVYDEVKDTLIEDKELGKKYSKSWFAPLKILDDILVKKDYSKIMKSRIILKWSQSQIKNDSVKVKNIKQTSDVIVFGHYISKPYYVLSGKYALVLHSSVKLPTLFMFKKEHKKWMLYDKIEQFKK